MKYLLVLFCLVVFGCANFTKAPEPLPDVDVAAILEPPKKGRGGGVYTSMDSWSLTSDSRAFRTGDVLTVVLEETTQASKKAGTRFGKQSDVDVGPTLLGNGTLNTRIGINADRRFDGSSSSTQQNMLSGALTVIVHKVLPNGLLLVKGEKQLTLNQGEEFIRLSGYVRISDIDMENRVSSQRIANARIAYSGSGVLNDANAPGWLTRFFTGKWMPF